MNFNLNLGYNKQIVPLSINGGDKQALHIGNVGINTYLNGVTAYTNPGDEVINMQIGNYCSIGEGTMLQFNRDHDISAVSTSAYLPVRPEMKRKGQIIIGHDVWTGNNVIIMPGTIIGHEAVIGAGSIVRKSVPPFAIVAGNPAKVIRYRFEEEQIQSLLETEWWYWPVEKVDDVKNDFALGIERFLEKHAATLPKIKSFSIDAKKTKILLYPDFEAKYPVWINVLEEYMNRFKASDDISLVFRIIKDANYENAIRTLQTTLPANTENMADLYIVDDEIENEESLFSEVDYFVTNRQMAVMRHIDFASRAKAVILSGVDKPVLDAVTL